jgi:hypothetical protein
VVFVVAHSHDPPNKKRVRVETGDGAADGGEVRHGHSGRLPNKCIEEGAASHLNTQLEASHTRGEVPDANRGGVGDEGAIQGDDGRVGVQGHLTGRQQTLHDRCQVLHAAHWGHGEVGGGGGAQGKSVLMRGGWGGGTAPRAGTSTCSG